MSAVELQKRDGQRRYVVDITGEAVVHRAQPASHLCPNGEVTDLEKAGNESLDMYERSLQNLVDFEERAAGASQLDWVSSMTSAYAKFMSDISNAYVSAAREMLK